MYKVNGTSEFASCIPAPSFLLRREVSLSIVEQLPHLDASKVILASTQLAIMVEQPPSTLELNNGVMCSPAQDWLENAPAVGEWAIGACAGSVAQVVGVAGRVAEVVAAVVLVHPRSLEESSLVIVSLEGLLGLGV